MLFDEYEIYFTKEKEFLIFLRVQSKSENIIKNTVSTKHCIFCLVHFLCFFNKFVWNTCTCMKGFRAVTQHNVIIKNITSQSVLLFSLSNIHRTCRDNFVFQACLFFSPGWRVGFTMKQRKNKKWSSYYYTIFLQHSGTIKISNSRLDLVR
jgi:hypothetical protein